MSSRLLVQSLAVSKPDTSASAIVVSGGKQYRVVPGDRILVDRLAAEPGSAVKLGRVLLFSDAEGLKVGRQADGLDVDAKVIAHRRGPRIESIRYKSKKRVRVHHGGRAHLTALEIIAVGGVGLETEKEEEVEETAKPKRGRAKAEPKKKAAPKAKAEAAEPAEVEETTEEAPKKTTRRRAKKETE
jgi:large subunit ribosomal protein L21